MSRVVPVDNLYQDLYPVVMMSPRSLRALTLLWFLNLAFVLISGLLPETSGSEYGFIDLPKDQNIVCTSGLLKEKSKNLVQNSFFALFFSFSTKFTSKTKPNQSASDLYLLKKPLKILGSKVFFKRLKASPLVSRGPPSLLS